MCAYMYIIYMCVCLNADFILSLAVQREHDVQESILFMAKQSGNVDPDVRMRNNVVQLTNDFDLSPSFYSDHTRPGGYGG